MLTRREFAAALAVTPVVAETTTGVQVDLSRFMMKDDFARVFVEAPAYRFVWHGRFFGFRIIAPAAYDARFSYSNFGLFERGGQDLICNHYQPILLHRGGQTVFLGGSSLHASGHSDVVRLDHFDARGQIIRVIAKFWPDAIEMVMETANLEGTDPLQLTLPGNLVFDRKLTDGYASNGLKIGLRAIPSDGGSVTVRDTPEGVALVCSVPVNQTSRWMFVPSPSATPRKPSLDPAAHTFRRLAIPDLKTWETAQMSAHGWRPDTTGVKERVAGVFIAAEGWPGALSWMTDSHLDFVAKNFLPKIIASRCFKAVGLSRDGITERGGQPAWLALVAQAHHAGLRVYMKPGDGELTALQSREQIETWAGSNFDVPAEQRCDVVRMPWEAVLHPWVCANLSLQAKFYTSALRNMQGQPWPEVNARLVTSVADRFSRIIEAIRRHAPQITIDLESPDTAVLDTILKRHPNIGLMYMAYGQFPRTAEVLDLYHSVARHYGAKRIVLESDCYYSARVTSLGALHSKPSAELYSSEDIRLMAEKHRHMNQLAADASWAWGMNINLTEEKFSAIAGAGV